jgi:putative FmdB family regulatory protein
MPTYEHLCPCGKITEVMCRIKDRKQFVVCEHCGGSAERIISLNQGIQDSDPTWLPAAVESAVNLGEVRKPETRQEYNAYLKNHRITCLS